MLTPRDCRVSLRSLRSPLRDHRVRPGIVTVALILTSRWTGVTRLAFPSVPTFLTGYTWFRRAPGSPDPVGGPSHIALARPSDRLGSSSSVAPGIERHKAARSRGPGYWGPGSLSPSAAHIRGLDPGLCWPLRQTAATTVLPSRTDCGATDAEDGGRLARQRGHRAKSGADGSAAEWQRSVERSALTVALRRPGRKDRWPTPLPGTSGGRLPQSGIVQDHVARSRTWLVPYLGRLERHPVAFHTCTTRLPPTGTAPPST